MLERETNRYVLARCARLLPALWVVTILEVTVVGMVCTTLPIGEYLHAQQTREHLYNVFIFPIRSVLSEEKKLSMAALSHTLPDRLIEQVTPLSAMSRWNCSLVY